MGFEEKVERETAISKAFKSELADARRTNIGCECDGRKDFSDAVLVIGSIWHHCLAQSAIQQALCVGSLAFYISGNVSL